MKHTISCQLVLEDDGQAMLYLDAELTDEDRAAVTTLFPRGYKQERPWVHHTLTSDYIDPLTGAEID